MVALINTKNIIPIEECYFKFQTNIEDEVVCIGFKFPVNHIKRIIGILNTNNIEYTHIGGALYDLKLNKNITVTILNGDFDF